MPCRTEVDPEQERRQLEENFMHDSKLADLFCQVMSQLEEIGDANRLNFKVIERMPTKALVWWEEHKERDRKRVAAELEKATTKKQIKDALAKLTPRERRLLGL